MIAAGQGSGALVWIILLVVLVLILGAAYGYYAQAKRRKMLALWARAKGLSFDPSRQHGLAQRYGEFDCLRQGENQYAYNVMAGDWSGRLFAGLDYHYETHSRDSKGRRQTHHHHFSAVILESQVALKPLFIRPEGLFDKVTAVFGFEDIDFESAEFSRKFYVKAPEKKWAYDVITQRTMEFLLSQPRFSIKFDPRGVIAYRAKRFSTADFEAAADLIKGMLDRLPDYLVHEQRGPA